MRAKAEAEAGLTYRQAKVPSCVSGPDTQPGSFACPYQDQMHHTNKQKIFSY